MWYTKNKESPIFSAGFQPKYLWTYLSQVQLLLNFFVIFWLKYFGSSFYFQQKVFCDSFPLIWNFLWKLSDNEKLFILIQKFMQQACLIMKKKSSQIFDIWTRL